MRLSDIHVPSAWEEAVEQAVAGGGPTLLLGAVDTGKSTFAHLLLARHQQKAGTVALLDGDIGQATVGTPGLLGLTLVADVDSLDDRTAPDRSYFIGASSPAGCVLEMVLGHSVLMTMAREAPIPLVVNSCGMVQGAEAKQLHLAIADIVRPRTIVALQAEDELEHLLAPLSRRDIAICRVQPSPRARSKPVSYRDRLRAERFAAYFEGCERHEIRLAEFALEGITFGSGQPLDDADRAEIERGLDAYLIEAESAGRGAALILASSPHDQRGDLVAQALGRDGVYAIEAAETSGLLVGFLAADGECQGLGLIDGWEGSGKLSLHSPLDAEHIALARRLAFGRLRLARTGAELGQWQRERRLGSYDQVDRSPVERTL